MAFIGVGSSLRAERLRQGLSVADVAKRTRIPEKLLQDIESERFENLPGLVFARNFVRQYATEIGLDPEPLLAELPRVDIDSAPMPVPQSRERRTRWDPRWNSAFSSAAWLILAVGAGVAGYIHYNRPAQPVATEPQSPPQARIERKTPPPSAATPMAAPPEPSPAPAPADPHSVQVVLTAKEDAWVQVTADGKNDFTGVLPANTTRQIEADQLVKVITGNAGGVAITLNGKPLDPLGPTGQVRTVRLTAEGPQLVVKTPPPAPADPASNPL